MREIFFEEKLGETGRGSEKLGGVRAAQAERVEAVGCDPQGWERWVGSEGGLEW